MLPLSCKTFVCGALATFTTGILVGAPSLAQAAALRLGDITFSEIAGDYRITGGFRQDGYYFIQQEVYGPNVDLVMAIDGFPRLYDRGYLGIQIQSIVTNLTNTPWIFFDHELQQVLGRPSPEADGLSFAQGIRSVRPFVSNIYARADEVTDVRDFINYSQGVLNPGGSAIFRYAITDTTPVNRFYLLQRPNFAPGGIGFVPVAPITPPPPPPPPPPPVVVQPPPPPPPPPPVVVQPPPPVVVAPSPEPSPPATPPVVVAPSPEPSPPPVQDPSITPGGSTAVPEPSTLLGIGLTAVVGGWLRRRG
ncbi:MAG TPA: PEP-CTERM sorting domain-containing protein [Leptolyngbyaceae cyanobacterium M33_DOE_097]|uniref:PEP-CTERM sorting domain-containing protein n=1 Tax=Oscillatoriales cyanobacterium SpSt-418 TaxID=2282169 RepID=A0A7C3PFU4_9CYAN|nr:PEP-CTERM sorting domain-containing protein [Leptolyngbyaceae cyanobacterium M33_DOE_097]